MATFHRRIEGRRFPGECSKQLVDRLSLRQDRVRPTGVIAIVLGGIDPEVTVDRRQDVVWQLRIVSRNAGLAIRLGRPSGRHECRHRPRRRWKCRRSSDRAGRTADPRSSAMLTPGNHHGRVEQAAHMEVFDQCGVSLVERRQEAVFSNAQRLSRRSHQRRSTVTSRTPASTNLCATRSLVPPRPITARRIRA